MAKPFKFRNKTTGEIVEFEWDEPEPPTKFDIDRIVSERRAPDVKLPDIEPPDSLISTPRFPTRPSAQIEEEPTFRTEVFGDYLLPEPYPKRTFDEPPSFKSEAKKGWNLATTPLFPEAEEALFSTIGKYDPTGIAEPVTRFIGGGATSPLGMFTGGLGSLAALKGGKLLGKAAKYLKGADELEDIAPPPKPISQSLSQIDDAVPNMPVSDAVTGTDVLPEMAATVSVNPKPIRNLTAQLPHELRGAKPRYNIGTTSYEPKFENDIDKALFIVSQDKPSKRNADYMKFVMDSTGMTAEEAMMAGKAVRSQLGTVLKGQKLGVNKIPKLYNPQDISPLPEPLNVVDELPVYGPEAPQPNSLTNVGAGNKLDPLSDVSDNLNPPEMNPAMISEEGREIANKLRETTSKTGKTTSVITGNEVGDVPPQQIKAAEQKLPETGVPPSAQVEQSINDFVPKNMTEALEQLESIELKMREAGKDETFISHVATQFWNFPKSSWATLDLSAPLRQGKGLIYRGEYWRAFDDMIRSGLSEKGYVETMARIKGKELYPLMKKYDPGIIDLEKSGKSLLKQEESRMSDWAENIPSLKSMAKGLKEWDIKHARTYVFQPEGIGKGKEALGQKSLFSRGVRASNRAYSGFLNTLRADTFENMVYEFEKSGLNPMQNPELLKSTADFIASATGRSSLGKFEATAETLNKYSFSIRYAKSRFDMGVLAPVKWRNAPIEIQNKVARSFLGQAIWTSSFLTLAHAGGAEVGLDPTSSDFGKIKIGDTRLDTLAGIQQPIVAVTRILSKLSTSPTTGKTTELGEGYRPETGVDIAANFTRNKLSPWTGLGWDTILKGKTPSGKDTREELARVDLDNYMVKMLAPNLISTLIDLGQEDPKYLAQLGIPASRFFTADGKPYPIPVILSRIGLAGLSALGEGVQVFDEPPPQKVRKKGYSSYSYEGRKR